MTELAQALRDLDEKKVYALVDKKIEEGTPATSIIAECNEGIVAVGQLFSEQKYYITKVSQMRHYRTEGCSSQ